jgi:hypothetical protein
MPTFRLVPMRPRMTGFSSTSFFLGGMADDLKSLNFFSFQQCDQLGRYFDILPIFYVQGAFFVALISPK